MQQSRHDVLVRIGAPILIVVALAATVVLAGRADRERNVNVPDEYVALIERHGTRCPMLNPARLAAQLYQESRFDSRALSSAGAVGIAQFIPGTWDEHGLDANGDGRSDPNDPEDAIAAAAAYDCHIADLLADVPGDPVANMLAGYNAGPYAVIHHRGVPPYPETQGYVKRIKELEEAFADSFWPRTRPDRRGS